MGPRSIWKRAFVDPGLIQEVTVMFLTGSQQKYAFQTDSRNSMIIPEFVGLRFEVYNGRDYTTIDVKEEHVGYKFGAFAYTRRLPTSIYDNGHKKG